MIVFIKLKLFPEPTFHLLMNLTTSICIFPGITKIQGYEDEH